MEHVRCPCLSGEPYDGCCGPYHRGEASAPTAERLMRSRFSAFAVGDAEYLLATWHPSTRPASLDLDERLRWYRLDIHATQAGGLADDTGVVEFTAYYKPRPGADVAAGEQHEVSEFERAGGRWYFVE
ncbi:YchJ family metal-binding protein [Salinibacterium sp. SYSU T00001]|uniref:YchJ family protein n=1 Tax=Homoserinimonas sedimenticola TaxID=2986805 RepID=UPI00223623E6|nr:YchJ family metal-binding protein [Salinibacterium sedimenticola]MCW4386290.1 YchJ family metal-binding protein [Salinibacterium sedimenticola]